MFFEDFEIGLVFNTGSKKITKDEIISFAKNYDPQYFHVDENRAKAVSSGEEEKGESTTSPSNSKKSNSSKKSKGGSSTKTVLPTGKTTISTPNRTDYNSKSDQKKKKTRKGELKTKVKESAPKGSTLRKVSRKL